MNERDSYKGLFLPNGAKNGIARRCSDNALELCCFKNNKAHGLYLYWYKRNFTSQFYAKIYQEGAQLGSICWDAKWNERSASNREVCEDVFTLADFKA